MGDSPSLASLGSPLKEGAGFAGTGSCGLRVRGGRGGRVHGGGRFEIPLPDFGLVDEHVENSIGRSNLFRNPGERGVEFVDVDRILRRSVGIQRQLFASGNVSAFVKLEADGRKRLAFAFRRFRGTQKRPSLRGRRIALDLQRKPTIGVLMVGLDARRNDIRRECRFPAARRGGEGEGEEGEEEGEFLHCGFPFSAPSADSA